MSGPISKISVLLNGGQDTQSSPELAGPIAAQGAPITLKVSRNTRLSQQRGTCTRAPAASLASNLPAPFNGMVSSQAGRNAVAFQRPGLASSKIVNRAGGLTGLGAGDLLSPLNTTLPQNSYVPADLTRSGAIPSVLATCPPAVTFDPVNRHYWTAYQGVRPDGLAGNAYFVMVTDVLGTIIAPPAVVQSLPGADDGFIGITCHGSNGMRMWTQYFNAITWTTLTLTGNVVTVGGTNTAYTPSNADTKMSVVSGLEYDYLAIATTTLAQYAYVACSSNGVPNDGVVTKININTNAYAGFFSYAAACTGGGGSSVCIMRLGGSFYMGLAFNSKTSGLLTVAVVDPVSMAGITQNTAVGSPGVDADVALQFISTPLSGNALIAVHSTWGNSFSAAALTVNGCTFYSMALVPASPLVQRAIVPWSVLRSQGTLLKISSTEQYPVFDLVRNYGTDAATPLRPDSYLDPSIEMWMAGSLTSWTPVARYGTVRFAVAPARVAHYPVLNNSLCSRESLVYAAYLKDIVGSSAQGDYPGRFVEVDFQSFQPRTAQDKDGVAVMAAALPVQWDGVEVVEVGGPLHAPKLRLDPGGTGPVFPIGHYHFAAYFSWTDAGGLEHRSAVATYEWDAPGGTSPQLWAPLPDSMRRGTSQTPVDLIVFASATNGATLHRLPERPVQFLGVLMAMPSVSTPDTSRQQIYSRGATGEEQMPQPPPPMSDITIIGDRAWALDAEITSRVVYSKHRIAGRGFEWHPAYECLLPAGAGRTTAIREWQGNAVIFTEYAIYVVTGNGPDNLVGNPSGGAFDEPTLVASIGCSSRESVLVIPGGIAFERNAFMYLFTGGEPSPMPGIQVTGPVTGAYLLRDYNEAVFLVDGSAKVWNYELSRWTTWDCSAKWAHTLAYNPLSVLLSDTSSTSGLYLVDSAHPSVSAAMSWETDWIVLGGDFQDHILLQHVLISARSAGVHGVTVEILTNYDETTNVATYTSRAWSAAEISALPTPARYTLRVQPSRQDSRAVKVRVTETEVASPYLGMRPICLTFVFAVEAREHENALDQGSYK